MKDNTHPKYHQITFKCACGASYTAGSTMDKDFSTEICSNCHPFFTGKQKLIDSSGRVDKFMAKRKKAEETKAAAKANTKKKRSKFKIEEIDTESEESPTVE